jgi:hypothetical protein
MFRVEALTYTPKKALNLINLLPSMSVFVDRVLETIFVEIHPKNSKQIIIGSVYRPGTKHPTLSTADQFSQFLDLLSNICNETSTTNTTVYVAGDFNLDALCTL